MELPEGATFEQLLEAAGLKEDYTASDGEVAFGEVARSLHELKQLRDDKQNGVGKAPEKYDFSLPADFKGPEGYQWQPDQAFTDRITEIARQADLGQDHMTKLALAYAEREVEKITQGHAQQAERMAEMQKGHKAEFDKLGPDGGERINAIKKYLDANHGDGAGDDFMKGGSARGIEILEDLISKAHGEGRSAVDRGGPEAKPKHGDLVGKKGGARELLRIAEAKKR